MARQKNKPQVDVMQFKGMVVHRAAVYYRMLPLSWRASIEFIDFVQIGLLCLVGRMKAYDPSRGAMSTLVYTSLDNCYKGVLERVSYKKRSAEIVDYEDVVYSLRDSIAQESLGLLAEAEVSVKKLHRAASFELLCMLDDAFFHQDCAVIPRLRSNKFQVLRNEFRQLADRHGVSIDSYRLAIALHHARTFQAENL